MKWPERRALRPSSALLCGTGLGAVLFGNLMVPSYGAGDLQVTGGIPAWQIVGLAGVANLAIAVAGAVLAMTGWQPRWQWVSAAFAAAAAGLAVPLLVPISSTFFLGATTVALLAYGLGAGLGQLTEQTAAVACVDEGRRSQAVGEVMQWHLLAGMILGGIPIFLSWRGGEIGLVVAFAALAVAVAVRRRSPLTGVREWHAPRRLWREAGAGGVVVAIGMAGWVTMYLFPGILGMSATVIALYAVAAQGVAFLVVDRLGGVADRNRLLAATMSGAGLLAAILGVAVLPAVMKTDAGIWLGGACFVAGEIFANLFITAIEGLISVEIGGQRAQLVGHSLKFAAVGTAGAIVAILAGGLGAHLAAAESAVALGVIVVGALGTGMIVSLSRLRVRHRPPVAQG